MVLPEAMTLGLAAGHSKEKEMTDDSDGGGDITIRVKIGGSDMPSPIRQAVHDGHGDASRAIRVTGLMDTVRVSVNGLMGADRAKAPLSILVDDGSTEWGRGRNPALVLTAFGTEPWRLAMAFRALAKALDAAELNRPVTLE